MDIYTKIFLINMVSLISTLKIDSWLLNDVFENTQLICIAIGVWVFLTTLSLPAWLIYLIVTW